MMTHQHWLWPCDLGWPPPMGERVWEESHKLTCYSWTVCKPPHQHVWFGCASSVLLRKLWLIWHSFKHRIKGSFEMVRLSAFRVFAGYEFALLYCIWDGRIQCYKKMRALLKWIVVLPLSCILSKWMNFSYSILIVIWFGSFMTLFAGQTVDTATVSKHLVLNSRP